MLEVTVQELSVTRLGHCLVLRSPGKPYVVPIFIGPLETFAITSVLESIKPERPLTHDLMAASLESTGYKVEKVFIDGFKDGTFYAKLSITKVDKLTHVMQLDARPSDAIALALRFQAPIFMAEHVFHAASVELSFLDDKKISQESAESGLEQTPWFDELEELLDAVLRDEEDELEAEELPTHFANKKQVLEKMLKTALAREDYEEAARLRDEIRQLGPKAGGD